MKKHKFAAGDRVIASSNTANQNIRPGLYTIVRALPVSGFGCQYRVRNALDTHERVVDEDLLHLATG